MRKFTALFCLLISSAFLFGFSTDRNCNFAEVTEETQSTEESQESIEKSNIRWIDFNASSKIIKKAQSAHKKFLENQIDNIGTCELLAFVATKNGNKFNFKTDGPVLDKLVGEIKAGNTASLDKYADNKYFKYYVESFHAVLDGIIDPLTGNTIGFHPIAKDFWHTGYDDFGVGRSYGFKRKHLGHDLFGGVGTPIIAVEGGTITELGWNRYGGWRVGIRSDDTKRYYYYAHLKKDNPYPMHFEIGTKVNAGDIVGFLGRTGYSSKENTNMPEAKPHLHFGMQIILDESQEDGNGEIWIDVYQICKFLSSNKSPVVKDEELGQWVRKV
ncbi:MAG: M23 family metallopeptidase [Firmicutes bacterium]|nr:M23 family metallopeptidase [Bacillota bacterium]